ncbi:MAG: MaoC family dehydratase N-terminal domain-containing protein [Deltaproteobacteria bacterium]|nr:MaoC family dehydratase N-terminal domain-containing protein [Deltaproteobacteria bacterium]
MPQDSIITEEMRKAVGVESEPSIYEIEKEPIRRWAEAIGDPNPLYRDEEFARKCGYDSIIAPPGFVAQYAFPVKIGKSFRRLETPLKRNLNGGNDYEFFKPVQAGDTLSATTKLIDLYEREGRLGTMLFQIAETTFKNQKGEVVAKARYTGISY